LRGARRALESGTPVVVRIPPFELVVPEPEIGYC